jgi:hypothetical protein
VSSILTIFVTVTPAIAGRNLSASISTRCIFGFREDKAISFNSLVQNHPFGASKKDLSH